ncbi:MAG: Mov34/MPN/PAD-1 family protein [Planctomycetes bacterium]|nr:Mov34/MPN/PAD-1 family protein [Planctomycetota bacterium]
MTVDRDRKLDTVDITLGDLCVADFPTACDWDPFRVHISTEAYAAIIKHAQDSDRVELCGVLVGELLKDDHGPFLSITHTIRGEYAEHHAAQVTFTQETWAHIHRVMDTAHPNRSIVGWYHTHPGFGVFLSEMDLFIHRNFFNLPWQVAFVVDPRSTDQGFFVWRDGEPARTRTYWVGDEERMRLPEADGDAGNLTTVLKVLREDVEGLHHDIRCTRGRVRRLRIGFWLQFILLLGVVAWVGAGFIWHEECEKLVRNVMDWVQALFRFQ